MRKFKFAVAAAALFILLFVFNAVALGWGNQSWFDFTYNFDSAIVFTPNGIVAEGRVDTWKDYEDSDVVQVTINGVTYLTHYSNVILISK